MSINTQQQLFFEPISGHAFNKDLSQIVVSDSSQTTKILKKDKTGKYKVDKVLKQHIERVTSVDWAPATNRIVTCGGDRNAYVWTYCQESDEWKPGLVLLRINRAATFVRWSPKEDRFAVGSGARLLSVCYFEAENNWWVSKHIKKPIRSTILSVDWHPNNYLLAVGSCDFKCRVFSSALKELSDQPETSPWMPKLSKFGVLLAEFDSNNGWVHGVKFSPSGSMLAWVAHDCSVNVVNMNNMDKVHTIHTNILPYMSVLWLTNNSFVTAGHNNYPDLYNVDEAGNVKYGAKLDVTKETDLQGNLSAMARFQKLDEQGIAETGTRLTTTHLNAITELRVVSKDRGNVTAFSSTGKDGKLVIWDVGALCKAISGLKI